MLPLTVRVEAPDGPVQVWVWPAEPAEEPGPGPETDGGRPLLLACHGWADSGEVFGTLAARLGRRWTVVAPDAPGHAGTPLRPGDYVIADHVTSVLAVLQALPGLRGRSGPGAAIPAGRPVVAYGHSLGALTATRLAATTPDLISALVLEDPARSTMRRRTSARALRDWLGALNAGDHESRLAWARAHYPDWPTEELAPWARSKATTDPAVRRIGWGEPLPELLAEVHCPVLLIRGEPARGGIVSAVAARRCVAACPSAVEVLALAVGHSPRREAPAEVAAAVAEVLHRADRRSGSAPASSERRRLA